jgi:hypothetical protein
MLVQFKYDAHRKVSRYVEAARGQEQEQQPMIRLTITIAAALACLPSVVQALECKLQPRMVLQR